MRDPGRRLLIGFDDAIDDGSQVRSDHLQTRLESSVPDAEGPLPYDHAHPD